MQIVSQLNTFILAAFESTAAATVFTIYYIAQHPAVEARLVQELKAAQQAAGGKGAQLNLEEVRHSAVLLPVV
jgi:cytochrome P450